MQNQIFPLKNIIMNCLLESWLVQNTIKGYLYWYWYRLNRYHIILIHSLKVLITILTTEKLSFTRDGPGPHRKHDCSQPNFYDNKAVNDR